MRLHRGGSGSGNSNSSSASIEIRLHKKCTNGTRTMADDIRMVGAPFVCCRVMRTRRRRSRRTICMKVKTRSLCNLPARPRETARCPRYRSFHSRTTHSNKAPLIPSTPAPQMACAHSIPRRISARARAQWEAISRAREKCAGIFGPPSSRATTRTDHSHDSAHVIMHIVSAF